MRVFAALRSSVCAMCVRLCASVFLIAHVHVPIKKYGIVTS